MCDEKYKNNIFMSKKAEELVKNQFDQGNNPSKDVDELNHDLRVHQSELKIQNEELRKAQIKLEDSQRKYFDLYNFAPVGYFTLDKEGIISEVNLTGASLLDIEKLNLHKRAFIQYIDPDYRNKFHQHIKKVDETGTKNTTELKLLRSDNNSFYAHFETINVQDENGNFKEYRITITDITAYKKAENSRYQRDEIFRLIFDQSLTGFIIASLDFTPLRVNNALSKMLGYSKDELLKMKFNEYTFSEDLDVEVEQKKLLILGEIDNFVLKKRYIHKNGDIVWGNLSVYAIKDQTGKPVCIMTIVEDITRRKQMELLVEHRTDKLTNINRLLNIEIDDYEKAETRLEELIDKLEMSNKELEQFAYVSSHDLKEPLRMITTFLQLLKRRYADDLDEDANDFINFAVEGAKRLNIMINDLLEYSRIGSQARELNYVNCEEILKLVLINLKTLIEDNYAVITYDSLPTIYANDQQMVQLFQNLISNAIKYRGNENPEIHISSDKHDKEYIFAVKDNGIGIDTKHLERIFTIFQRLHTREEYEGSGIGLAIAYKILQQHHGKIWAESEPGKGTTIYFTLPNKK